METEFNTKNLEVLAKKLSVGELEERMGKLLKSLQYNTIVCENQEFKGIYRARKHNAVFGKINQEGREFHFNSEKEFWNPPKENIKSRGRCNDVNESMFYGSNEFETAIAEVRPKKGEYITVAAFEPILSGGIMPRFNVKPVCIQHLQKIDSITSCAKGYDLSNRSKVLRDFDNYLDKLFTKTVNKETDYLYKLTVAITHCMIVDLIDKELRVFPTAAMLYPSILRNYRSCNILFKPEHIERNFEIKHLQTLMVLRAENRGVELKLVRNGQLKGFKKNQTEKLDVKWFEVSNGNQEFIRW